MCWKILLIIDSKENPLSKPKGTVAIVICSHFASQIGCVVQWRQDLKSTSCDEQGYAAKTRQVAYLCWNLEKNKTWNECWMAFSTTTFFFFLLPCPKAGVHLCLPPEGRIFLLTSNQRIWNRLLMINLTICMIKYVISCEKNKQANKLFLCVRKCSYIPLHLSQGRQESEHWDIQETMFDPHQLLDHKVGGIRTLSSCQKFIHPFS